MITLHLLRHCESSLNVKEVYYGWTDCGLSAKGMKQCEDLRQKLCNIAFDVVYASPLLRAVETSCKVSGYSREQIVLDHRLKELHFGEWEGLHYKEIEEKYRLLWEQWMKDWKNTRPPKGENFMDLYNRVYSFLKDLTQKHENQTILVVSHQGCLRAIASILLSGNEDLYWSFAFEQGAYSVFEVDQGHCIVKKINCRE